MRPLLWWGAPFAVGMMGIEVAVFGSNPLVVLPAVTVSGSIFGGAMGILNASNWVRTWLRDQTKLSLATGETIQVSGLARFERHSGILYLTDRRLRFTAHFGTKEWAVSLPDIVQAHPTRTLGGLVPNGVRIETTSQDDKQVTTWEREEWCDTINEHV